MGLRRRAWMTRRVIDDMAVLAAGMRSTAAHRHQRCRAEKAFEPIVVEAHSQAMADQPRRHRIEHGLYQPKTVILLEDGVFS